MTVNHPDPASADGPPAARRWLIWVGTAAAALAGSVLLTEPFKTNRSTSTAASTTLNRPDLELEDATITQFRDTGKLKYLLNSPRIEHFRADASTRLTEPDLELYSDPDPPWRMTARKGSITNAEGLEGAPEEAVFLDEQVQMAQTYPDGRSFELRTPNVTVYPDREYAETSRNVMITTHAGRTHAVGLQGDLDQGLLHLFSNAEQRVHTILLPDQFK